MYKKIFLLLLIIGILNTKYLILDTVPAHAQQAASGSRVITISPPSVQKGVNPGDVVTGSVKVINDSNEPLTFTTSVLDYVVLNNSGIPSLITEGNVSNKYAASSWVQTSPSVFTVNPQQRQDVFYTLTVPTNARPGGHYTALVFTPQESIKAQGTGAQVKTQIGTLFYISVSGPITQQANITRFSAPFFSEYGPVTVETQITNRGDLHIRPGGSITVTD